MILLLRWNAWMDQYHPRGSTTTTTTATTSPSSSSSDHHDWISWMISMVQSWILVFGIFHNMAGSFLMQQQFSSQRPPALQPLVDDHYEEYGDDDHSVVAHHEELVKEAKSNEDEFPSSLNHQDFDIDMIDIFNKNI